MPSSISTRVDSASGVKTRAPGDAQAAALIGNARRHLGFHEGPSNENPFTKALIGTAHAPWCAAFVSTVLAESNIPGVSGVMSSASSAQLAGQFEKAGRYTPRGARPPQPGDVIFFGGRGGEHHVGIVQRVENGRVFTIEGNSSDAVSERSYSLDDPGIGGYGRVMGEGEVSNDLGFKINATAGRAGGRPSSRASGAGSSGRASSTGVDPASYFDFVRVLMMRMLIAAFNGDEAAVKEALAEQFPVASEEDLSAAATLLANNPKLAAAAAADPNVLVQLVGNPTPETAEAIMSSPPQVTGEGATMLAELSSSSQIADIDAARNALAPLMHGSSRPSAGWSPSPAATPTSGGWRPPT